LVVNGIPLLVSASVVFFGSHVYNGWLFESKIIKLKKLEGAVVLGFLNAGSTKLNIGGMKVSPLFVMF